MRSLGLKRKRPLGRSRPQRAATCIAELDPASLPPRFSCREPPIDWASRYGAGANGVKAILALLMLVTQNLEAGTAGHGKGERLTEIVRMQRPPSLLASRYYLLRALPLPAQSGQDFVQAHLSDWLALNYLDDRSRVDGSEDASPHLLRILIVQKIIGSLAGE